MNESRAITPLRASKISDYQTGQGEKGAGKRTFDTVGEGQRSAEGWAYDGGRSERALDPLQLGLWMIVSLHVDGGNRTQVL